MRQLTFALWLLLIPAVLVAQEASIMQQIKNEGIENSQVMDIAFHLTEKNGPRLMNSPGYYRAMDYSTNQLKAWGLENVAKDEYGDFGKGWELKKFYIAMKSPWYKPIIAFPKAWTSGTNGLKTAEVILIDPQADSTALVNNYRGKLAGKILAMDRLIEYELNDKPDLVRYTKSELDSLGSIQLGKKETDTTGMAERRSKWIQSWREARKKAEVLGNIAREEGAIAILSSSPRNHDGTVFVQGGGSYTKDAPENFLDIAMALEDYNMIVRLVRANEPVTLDLEMESQFYTDQVKGHNVIGEIVGTDRKLKDEVVMLGGHLDSWHGSVGATDNASGTAVMMEAMRILKALDIQPKRTVRIALWGGEEQGIHGSRGYVAKTFADRADMKLKPAHEKFNVYFNFDNGTGRINGIYLQENEAAREIMKKWLTPFEDLDAATITVENTSGTDHLSFDAVGLPGFQFIQDEVEYSSRTHHSTMDSYDHLVEDDLKQAATVVAGLIYQAAMSDQKVPRKELPKAQKSQF